MPDNDWLKPAPKQDTSWIKPATTKKDSGSVVTIGGVQQNLQDNPSMYSFTPKFGQDNEKLRAQDQPWLAQAGLMLGNGVSNIVTGLVEGFGYIPELFDDAHDYSNALTQTMQKAHNPFGEIRRENPDKVFDLSDPAWWFENVQQLGESAGAFALEGAVLGKLFGTTVKGAGELMQLSKKGTTIARAGAQTLTAGTLAYTEGAMSGYRVYDEVYKKQYDKALREGNSPDTADAQAKESAATAAATTVRMNTLMNTLLNLGEVAPLFKNPSDEALSWFKNQGRRLEGESLGTWKKRLADASFENPELRKLIIPRHGINNILAESAKEGIEEVNTQYAEAEGRRQGDGKTRNIFRALTDLGQYFTDVTNDEGALNFALGAFGGVAQTAILDHLPSRYTTYDRDNNQIVKKGADGKVEYDANGKPKYQQFLVSPKSYTERGTRQYFENIKDAIITDIDKQQDLNTKLIAATASKNIAEVERLRSELFSISALDAVAKGMTENWQEQYKQVAGLDNEKDLGEAMQPEIDASAVQLMKAQEQGIDTAELEKAHGKLIKAQQDLMDVTEAMQKGYATDKNDKGYKEKSERAVQDLKHLQNLHEQIQKQYVDHDNPMSGEVADHLFFRNANLYLTQRAIDRESMRIEKAEALQTHNLPSAENFDSLINKYNEHLNTWSSVIDQMNDDIKVLQGSDVEGIKSLFSKYRAKGVDENDFTGAIEDLVKKIQLKQKLYKTSISTTKDQMESSIGYSRWKENNPTGTFADYTNSVSSNAILLQDKSNLQYEKDLHEIATQNLNELTSGKGLTQLYRDLAEDKRKMIDKLNLRNKQDNLDKFFAQQSKAAVDRLSVVERQKLIAQLESQLTQWKTEYNTLEQKRVDLETQLKDYLKGKGIFTNLNKTIGLRQEISRVKARISSLEAQINSAEYQLALLIPKAEAANAKYEATVQTQETEEEVEDEELYQEPEEVYEPLNHSVETSYTADELINFEEPTATDSYIQLKETLPASIIKVLDKIESEHIEGTPYSYDKLKNVMRPFLASKEISQTTVNKIQIELREYLKEKATPVVPAQVLPVDEVETEDTQITEEETPAVEENVQPLTLENSALFTEDALDAAVWENSAKTTKAVKGNSSDLQYKTVEYNGVRKLRNVTENGGPVLDPTTNRETLIPGKFQPGHQVFLQIDTAWDGKILNDDELAQDENLEEIKRDDKFEMYLDNGKIKMNESDYGNVPIKIVDVITGKTLKYFPRVDWIGATQGAENFRNVEDLFPPDDNGVRNPGNVELQKEINLRIRKRMVEMWNANPDAKLLTTVTDVTGGRVMYHGDANDSTGKVKYRPQLAEKLLPDNSLQFGIANKDGLLVGKNKKAAEKLELIDISQQQMERLIGSAENPRSSVVAFIPMNNGKHLPVPMLTTPLNKRQGEINTIVRAIELYMQFGTESLTPQGEKLIGQIKDRTGFDITTPTGLKEFIEQYFTLTNNFSDTKTAADAEAVSGKKLVRWLFSVPDAVGARKDGKSDIKVGTTYSGKRPVRAQLVNGVLDTRFKDALTAGLNTRMKNVNFTNGNLKGVNDPRPITQVTINAKDVLSAKEYPNYNAYLKSFVQTSVFGKTQVQDSNGKSHYVYAVNGQMMLDASKLLPSAADATNARELVSNLQDVNQVEENFEDAADEIDAWGMDNSSRNVDIVKRTIQPEGKELTLANLTELYNFTPTDNRNAKSPGEVLQHLQDLGISKIADGYNPFLKC